MDKSQEFFIEIEGQKYHVEKPIYDLIKKKNQKIKELETKLTKVTKWF
jgi:hypothetical protein